MRRGPAKRCACQAALRAISGTRWGSATADPDAGAANAGAAGATQVGHDSAHVGHDTASRPAGEEGNPAGRTTLTTEPLPVDDRVGSQMVLFVRATAPLGRTVSMKPGRAGP